jgi:hypothetical protein
MKRIANDRNIQIYNATEGGELELYPRINMTDVVSIESDY